MEFSLLYDHVTSCTILRLNDNLGSNGQTRYARYQLPDAVMQRAIIPAFAFHEALKVMVDVFNHQGAKVAILREPAGAFTEPGVLRLPYGYGLQYLRDADAH